MIGSGDAIKAQLSADCPSSNFTMTGGGQAFFSQGGQGTSVGSCQFVSPDTPSSLWSVGFGNDVFVTLKLSAPMVVGARYKISLQAMNNQGDDGSGSACTIIAEAISFGSSADDTTFGTSLGSTSPIAISLAWSTQTFVFTATAADQYITFRMADQANAASIIFVDDVQIQRLYSDLSLTISAPCQYVGNTATVTYTVTNNGPDVATNVVSSAIDLPVRLGTIPTNMPVASLGGSFFMGTRIWSIPTLAVGESATLIFSETVLPAGDGNASAPTMSSDNTDSNAANDFLGGVSICGNLTASSYIIKALSVLTAAADNPSGTFPKGASNVVNVLANDTTNGNLQAILGTVTEVSQSTAGALILNSNGNVSIAPNLTTGTYTLTYSYCYDNNSTGCGAAKIANQKNKFSTGKGIADCTSECVQATVTIMVNNEVPIASSATNSAINSNSGATAISPLTGTDQDGTIVSYTILTLPTNGTLYVGGVAVTPNQVLLPAQVATLTYDPSGTFIGNETFTFTVTDNNGNVDATPATITIPVINNPPTATDVINPTVSSTGGQVAINPLAATDSDGTIVNYNISSLPSNGTLYVGGVAVSVGQILTPLEITTLTYESNGTVGIDSFTFTATDNNNQTDATPATYTIPVDTMVSDLALNISAPCQYIGSDTTVTMTVTNNGSADDTNVSLSGITLTGSNGAFTIVSTTPSTGTYDSTTGIWTIGNLANGASETLSFVVNVTSNIVQISSPTVSGDNYDFNTANNKYGILDNTYNSIMFSYSGAQNINVTNADVLISSVYAGASNVINVLANDTVNGVAPAWGTVSELSQTTPNALIVDSNGNVSVQPGTPSGTYSLTYQFCNYSELIIAVKMANPKGTGKTASDGLINPNCASCSLPTTLTVTVNNEVPIALDHTNASMDTNAGATAINPLSAMDSDGTIVNYTVLTLPAHGTLYLGGVAVSAGQILTNAETAFLTYDPNGTFVGNETFTFTATDNDGNIDATPATITIPLTDVAPIAIDSTNPTIAANTADAPLNTLTATDNGSIVSYTILTLPTNGTLYVGGVAVTAGQILNPAQVATLTYTNNGTTGIDTFTFTATDNFGLVDATPAQVTIPVDVLVSDLSLDITAPCQYIGQTTTVTMTVTNNGSTDDTNVKLTGVALPSTLAPISYTASAGTYDSATQVWTIGNLASGASATLNILVTVNGTQSVFSPVVSGDNIDPNTATNTYGINNGSGIQYDYMGALHTVAANNDSATSAAGAINVINVLTNDSVDGVSPGVLSNATVTTVSQTTPNALLLDANGNISVANNLAAGTYSLTYNYCVGPDIYTQNAKMANSTARIAGRKSINPDCKSCQTATVTILVTATSTVCYKPATTAGTALPTNHGITALGRAGVDNGNWPMVRKGAWTVLEAKTKGFVINRISTTALVEAIANPVEGMMVYDEQADCLKINTNGTSTGWKCFNTQTCP
ncbi:MAG: DUF11 domain-containing protein [Sphingobacteriales bacterium]|nr:MAG: DUF11 domain-containing protein [Sphingobacteriales bacterium]